MATPSSSLEFDYVVVGAGTAGCLLAERLSANPNHRVLLIEAGGKDNYHWIHIPVGYLYCIGNPRTDWCYQTEPEAGLNSRRLRYPRGKVLGGCSSINGMIYMRGQARDYDQWAALTRDDAWRWDNVLPDFIRHEDHYLGDAAHSDKRDAGFANYHGHGGPWRVEKQRLRWEILDAFARAAEEAGIPATADFNRGDNEGVAYFEVNQKAGWRWNTVRAFLKPDCLRRANFSLMHSTQTTRLLTERLGDDSSSRLRCAGVEIWNGRARLHVSAKREVILAAGAIGSAQLLQLSGIGPADWLHRAGVAPLLDLPGVGTNLQDHLQIRSVFKVQGVRTLNTRAASLWGKLQIGLQYLLTRSGPMSMAPSQLGAFTRSHPEQPYPNLEYHVQPLSLDAFGEPLHDFAAFTASVCNLNPSSRGHVRINTANFADAPAIAPNYLATDEDRQVAADSLRLTRHIVAQPALAAYQPVEFKPGAQYQTDAELVRLAGDIASTIFHPVGTCKMGAADDPMAVVDSRLRVRGVAGLRIADASIMPTITSGNTNSPTLMIAEKAAGWILAQA